LTWGLLRVKNEARWIEKVIRSLEPVCDRILVFDDHSTDGTPEICFNLGCIVHFSEFDGLDESRDKDFLLQQAWAVGAKVGDHCLMIDGDEALDQRDVPALKSAIEFGTACGSLHVLYLWDNEHQIRVDRWYREVRRASLFRLTSKTLSFRRTAFGGNFHCGSVPLQLSNHVTKLPVRLLHYGYMHKEDRVRKYHWYNQIDPNNAPEDQYRHMVVGDIFPADSRFKWAGPLEVKPL
jgi:glycosyltransferase involved in cell wall biosynthesis